MNRLFRILSRHILLLSLAGSTSWAATDVLLSETFPADKRLDQDLPDTAAWYNSSNSGISYSTGNLSSTSNRFYMAYFTDSGTVDLAVGESLSISFSLALDTPDTNYGGLRIGIFNSGGNRISSDGAGLNNPLYDDYVGYASMMNVNAGSAMKFSERNANLSEALIHSGTAYTSFNEKGLGDGATFTSGQFYEAVFTLTRTASGVEMSVAISGLEGYSATYTDTTSAFTSFDNFVIYGSTNAMDGYSLSEVEITYNSIPEASTSGLLVLAIFLPLLARFLRHRRN